MCYIIINVWQVNPLGVRLAKLFCSHHDGFMNFDDFLNMVAVMGSRCKPEVKLQWAFLLYGIYTYTQNELLEKYIVTSVYSNYNHFIISQIHVRITPKSTMSLMLCGFLNKLFVN